MTNPDTPRLKFTIIALSHNQYSYIKDDLLKSIHMGLESFFDYEVIIVDDHSTEEEFKLLEALESDKITILQCPVKMNQSMSRNMGTEIATGDIIFHIDGDDWYSPSGLRDACGWIERNPNADLYCSRVMKPTTRYTDDYRITSLNPLLQSGFTVGTTQFAISRRFIEESGLRWDEVKYNWNSEDVWFWGMAIIEAKVIQSIDIKGAIVYHPLFRGSNSDGRELIPHLLYSMELRRQLWARAKSDNVRLLLSRTIAKRIKAYQDAIGYADMPPLVKEKITGLLCTLPNGVIITEKTVLKSNGDIKSNG